MSFSPFSPIQLKAKRNYSPLIISYKSKKSIDRIFGTKNIYLSLWIYYLLTGSIQELYKLISSFLYSALAH